MINHLSSLLVLLTLFRRIIPKGQECMNFVSFSNLIKQHLIRQLGLAEEQIEQMLPQFRVTLAGHLEALKKSAQADDLDNIRKTAHTIKGALLNLGLSDCAEIAMRIEYAAAAGDLSLDYPGLIRDIEEVVNEIIAEQ